MDELSGVPVLMRELGVGFPGRESFRAWYRRAPFPDGYVRTDVSLAETISGIVAVLFAGDQDERERLRNSCRPVRGGKTGYWRCRPWPRAGPTSTPAPCSPTAPPPTRTEPSGGMRCPPSPRAGPTSTPAPCSPTAPPPTRTDRPAGGGGGPRRGLARRADPHLLIDRATTDNHRGRPEDGGAGPRQGLVGPRHPVPAHRPRHHRRRRRPRRAVKALVQGWPDEHTRAMLTDRATTDDSWIVRQTALDALVQGWPDEDTRTLLTDRATTDDKEFIRQAAVQALAKGWSDEDTRTCSPTAPLPTTSWASGGRGASPRPGLARRAHPDLLIDRATTDAEESIRGRRCRPSPRAGRTSTPAPGSPTAPLPTTRWASGGRRYRPSSRAGPTSTPGPCSPTAPPPTTSSGGTAVQALAKGWPDEADPGPAHRPGHHRQHLWRPGGGGAGARPGLARRAHPDPAHRLRHHRHL